MMVGSFHALTGACPICGMTVTRTHAVATARGAPRPTYTETYACRRCGPTRY